MQTVEFQSRHLAVLTFAPPGIVLLPVCLHLRREGPASATLTPQGRFPAEHKGGYGV